MKLWAKRQRCVQLDAPDVHRPRQCRKLVDHAVLEVLSFVAAPDGGGRQLIGPVFEAAFLPEARPRDPLGVSVHMQQSLSQVRQQHLTDPDVNSRAAHLWCNGPWACHAVEIANGEPTCRF